MALLFKIGALTISADLVAAAVVVGMYDVAIDRFSS